MFELLFTSFPVVIRYFQLKRRGEAMTVWNMRTAVFLWAVLAFLLFTLIFYFHPKSYSGILPFRTVTVLAQTSGPVTEVAVKNGDRVSAGDLLFRIENSTQTAALKRAEAELAKIAAAEEKANDNVTVAKASLYEAEARLKLERMYLEQGQTLFERNVQSEDEVRQLEASVAIAEAGVAAAQAGVELAETDVSQTIPAQRDAAEAAIASAKVELAKTEVHSFADGVVTQLVLSEGSPASQLILNPAMVIIPDRPEDIPLRLVAGFSQVARTVLYEGMPAEIACDSNVGLTFEGAVLAAKVVHIQPAIATGQVVPGASLLDVNALRERGSLLVYFELEYPEQAEGLIDGSGCTVQTYTNNLGGFGGHIIAATGVIKAVGLRLKVWGTLISGIGLAGGGGH